MSRVFLYTDKSISNNLAVTSLHISCFLNPSSAILIWEHIRADSFISCAAFAYATTVAASLTPMAAEATVTHNKQNMNSVWILSILFLFLNGESTTTSINRNLNGKELKPCSHDGMALTGYI